MGSTISMPASGELGAERSEVLVVERPADQRDPVQLPVRGRNQPGVAVTEVDRRVGGQHVEVAGASTSVTQQPSALAMTTGSGL